jgi:hypothetical protein
MKIRFEITSVPTKEQARYLVAYFEGVLSIYVDEILFFHQPGIPLIEFAKSVHSWLVDSKTNEQAEFSYESMDFDEPILLIQYFEDDRYKLDSIWKEKDFVRFLSKDEIVGAFEEYLKNLSQVVEQGMKINLESFLQGATS